MASHATVTPSMRPHERRRASCGSRGGFATVSFPRRWKMMFRRKFQARRRMTREEKAAEELEWRRRWEEWMATDAEATRADDGFTLAMSRTP